MDYAMSAIKSNVKLFCYIIIILTLASSVIAIFAQKKEAKFLRGIFWVLFFLMMVLSFLVLLVFAPFYIAIAPLIPVAMYIYVLMTSRFRNNHQGR